MSKPTWWEQEGRDDALRTLISVEGKSYAEAALHFRGLGFPQITRNSCHKRAARIGIKLPSNVTELRLARKSTSARLQHRGNVHRAPLIERPVVETRPSKAPARDARGNVYDLETLPAGACKWPIGDLATRDLHFCAHPMAGFGPYCGDHMTIAQPPAKPRRPSYTPPEMARAFGGS